MNQIIEKLKECQNRLQLAQERVNLALHSTTDYECNEQIERKYTAIKRDN